MDTVLHIIGQCLTSLVVDFFSIVGVVGVAATGKGQYVSVLCRLYLESLATIVETG